MFRRLSMHGHSRAGAHAIGGLALLAAVAILVFVPPHLSLSAAGAAFFVVLAVKHLALAGAVGIPAASVVRRWGPRTQGGAGAVPRPDAQGWLRTGEAEPHRGVLRLEHDVRAAGPSSARQELVALDVDKRMTLRFLSDVDAAQLRSGLRDRYARRGYRDAAAVEQFLSPLARPIARGEALVIAYDTATKTTRATLGEASAAVQGQEFMLATWRLWFDDAVPGALAGALMQNLVANRLS
jgi:hypothetical protein